LKNPAEESVKLGGAQGAEQVFINLYRDFVSLPSANEAYRTLFLSMSEPSASPNVFHCTNGKDRTGWAAAVLLTFLGVSKEKVYEDFLLSNEYLLPQHEKEMDLFEAQGGDRGILVAFFGVKQSYLDAAFDEMHKRYGSIEQYFSKGLNINSAQQNRIKETYLSSKLVN
jgi:protein-tyrosine phosphatase